MANEVTGADTIAAAVRNTNAWGTGAAAVLGAGNQVEYEQENIACDAQLIENMGLSGQGTQLPGVKGNELHSGSFGPLPLYFRGAERHVAKVMGTTGGNGTQQGGDLAYKHTLTMAAGSALVGVFDTLAIKTAVSIWEWAFWKWSGFEILIEEGKYGLLTMQGVGAGLNLNIGSPITNRIVTSVTPANITFTIANQPTEPSPVSVTITDADNSITEFVVTFTGTDRDDNVITDVYRLTLHTKVWVGSIYFKTITSVVGSGLTGTTAGDTIICGVNNGANNATTIASVTLPSTTEINKVIFSQLELLLNVQSGGALATSDEVFITRFFLKVDRQMEGKVTTKLGNRVDEPIQNGFAQVTGGFNLADYNDANHPHLKDYLFSNKARKKATLTATGPIVAGTTASQMKIWLNELQFSKGKPQISGPGRTPFDVEFKAHRALTLATGFTSGFTQPCAIDIVNGNSGNPINQ